MNQKEISILQALLPVVVLMLLLIINVTVVFGDDALSGANQFALILAGFVAMFVGFRLHVSYKEILKSIGKSIATTTDAILILLMVGALSGTWLVSGIIPTMIYYGLDILNPLFFLPSCVIICAIVSVASGSSWTTSATVGIALIGIGKAMQIPIEIVAGAVISGSYFGDKISPLSDTTNLASAMAKVDIFTHIRYMLLTTVPTIVLTIIIFTIIGFFQAGEGNIDSVSIQESISKAFYIHWVLLLVPVFVILMIVKKVPSLIALLMGVLLASICAIVFQPDILLGLVKGAQELNFKTIYQSIFDVITRDVAIETTNKNLNDLFSSGGMSGMLNTIWVIICAMFFGGAMEAIGALQKISQMLLKWFDTVFGLFASTVTSCLFVNATASDQYLAIVVPGKMFQKAYDKKGLAPENLSRTLEDSGTVTSVLVPWNTCSLYESKVLLGQSGMVGYIPYAFFNILSPFVTLLYAVIKFKIKEIKN